MKNNPQENKKIKKEEQKEILGSIREIILSMKIALPKEISVGTFSTIAKIPFKVHALREALYHRVYNFSDTALRLIDQKEFIPALTLIRSVYECTALMFYVDKFVRLSIKKNKLSEDFDDRIMKLIFGSKNDTTNLKAINIVTIIDHWSKENNLIRKMYDDLSEFAHPNWSGLDGSYVKVDKEKLTANFNKIVINDSWPFELAISSLAIALKYFVYYYDGIAEYLKKFAELCEKDIENAKK